VCVKTYIHKTKSNKRDNNNKTPQNNNQQTFEILYIYLSFRTEYIYLLLLLSAAEIYVK